MSASEENRDPDLESPALTEPEQTPEVEDSPAGDAAADEPVAHEPAADELNLGQERVLEFISYVLVNLVEHPEDVIVNLIRRQDRDIYQVRVHADDLGKVIGKGGQTARALRIMLTALSAKTDQRIGLEIVE